MKVIILAGGFGTRLAEDPETDGSDRSTSDPVAHHEVLGSHGFEEFVVALGKAEVVRVISLSSCGVSDVPLHRLPITAASESW
jgi:hypothetical protein